MFNTSETAMICHSTMFFILFSEAEPFAAILLAHGSHVFGEG